jgi:hypothetical protein
MIVDPVTQGPAIGYMGGECARFALPYTPKTGNSGNRGGEGIYLLPEKMRITRCGNCGMPFRPPNPYADSPAIIPYTEGSPQGTTFYPSISLMILTNSKQGFEQFYQSK